MTQNRWVLNIWMAISIAIEEYGFHIQSFTTSFPNDGDLSRSPFSNQTWTEDNGHFWGETNKSLIGRLSHQF